MSVLKGRWALFLKDLADKTRRGLRGRVVAGKSGGGNSYGYDVVRRLDSEGQPVRGERKINESQANVIRRIFNDYAAGTSPQAIAKQLNVEKIPCPSGATWGPSTIHGNPDRGTGILRTGLNSARPRKLRNGL
jgi:DNA invertase Pin-like site-specific DNA recombinase